MMEFWRFYVSDPWVWLGITFGVTWTITGVERLIVAVLSWRRPK